MYSRIPAEVNNPCQSGSGLPGRSGHPGQSAHNLHFNLAQLWTDFSVLFILLLFSHWICNLRCSDLVTWDEDDFYSRGEEDAYKSHDEVNYHWKFPTNVSIFVALPPLFWVLVSFHCWFFVFFSITKESFNIKICYNNTKVLSYQNYTHTIPEESLW